MNTLLVSVLFVGTCAAIPQPCCIQNKFTTKAKVLRTELHDGSDTPTFIEHRVQVDVDKYNGLQRVQGSVTTYDGSSRSITNYTTLSNFVNGTQHGFVEINLRPYCNVTTTDLADQIINCVPNTLHWSGTVDIGSGSESITLNTWDGVYQNYTWSMQTLDTDCTPVSYARFGMESDGTRVLESFVIADMIQGEVSSPHVFDVPSACNQ